MLAWEEHAKDAQANLGLIFTIIYLPKPMISIIQADDGPICECRYGLLRSVVNM